MDLVARTQELDPTKFLDIYNFIVDLYYYIQKLSTDKGADSVAPIMVNHIASMSVEEQQKLCNIFAPLTWFNGPLAYAATTLLSTIENVAVVKNTRRKMSYAEATSISDLTPLLTEIPKLLTCEISLKKLTYHPEKQNSSLSKVKEELSPLLEFAEKLKNSNDALEQACWAAVCCLALALQNTVDNIDAYQKDLNLQNFDNDIENYKDTCRNYLKNEILPNKVPSWFVKFFCCCQSNQEHEILTRLNTITQSITFSETKMPVYIIN